MTPLRIALVCEGNPATSETAFSGTAKRMFLALQACGHEVIPIDAALPPLQRALAAALTLSPNRAQWRANFRYANRTCALRAAAARRNIADTQPDVILQIGATFDPPLQGLPRKVPYAIFCDWNMELHALEPAAPNGLRSGLSDANLASIRPRHRRRYEGASAVFTISERLRQSFLDLYNLPPDRVHTAYAGPNFDTALIEAARQKPRRSTAPTVLFIAKEFHRKGGPTVAAAFARLCVTLPTARLLFAGTAELPPELHGIPGVEHLGLLDKNVPVQLDRLLAAYRDTDLLVLPSHRDPFPTVVREAMFFGLPAIVSDIWAMPEMVVDGETGFLIPPGDTEALATRLHQLLTDDALRQAFGQAARRRAESLFTWPAVAKVLSDTLQQIASPKPSFNPSS
jgi:glycosyltransferase involved in cell wall biosynthesis